MSNIINKKEFVYFIKCNTSINGFQGSIYQYVKIGKAKSIENIKKRLSSIQVGSPFKLKFLGYVEGDEKYFHTYFSDSWVHGEWFFYEKIIDKLKKIKLKQFDDDKNNNGINISDECLYYFNRKNSITNEQLLKKLSRAIDYIFNPLEIKISKRKEIGTDYFGDTLSVGDYYFNLIDNYTQWNGTYLTINNAYKVYNLFKIIIRNRNDKFYYQKKFQGIQESLKNLKQIWKNDFNDIIFDEFKNNIVQLNKTDE